MTFNILDRLLHGYFAAFILLGWIIPNHIGGARFLACMVWAGLIITTLMRRQHSQRVQHRFRKVVATGFGATLPLVVAAMLWSETLSLFDDWRNGDYRVPRAELLYAAFTLPEAKQCGDKSCWLPADDLRLHCSTSNYDACNRAYAFAGQTAQVWHYDGRVYELRVGDRVIYSHPPKASYCVALSRRTTAYCLRQRALSETFGGWLYSYLMGIPLREGGFFVALLPARGKKSRHPAKIPLHSPVRFIHQENFTMNPVVLAVCLMLILSLARVHVVFSLIISAFIGGMVADIPAETILAAFPDAGVTEPDSLLKLKYLVKVFEEGIAAGTTTALSYAVLGAFAVAISYSGLSQAMANLIIGRAKHGKGSGIKWLLIIALLAMSIMSQNLVPIHIAFIPLVVPPLLLVMNRLKLDRRLLACTVTFGLVCTYMFVPYGFGDIFLNKILLGNISKFGMDVSGVNIYQAMAIPALGMVAGLAIAIFYSYRKPRDYQDLPVEGAAEQVPIKPLHICVALVAVIAAFLAQKYTGSLILAGLIGFAIFMVTHVIHWQQADTVFNSGIRMMSMIAFIMIAANGFAEVMNASGGVEPLVKDSVAFFGESRALVSLAMLVVGLLVTMGIGSSFSTLPIIAAIYVPICVHMGFSPLATVALIGTAGALGDAGSPASDSTLGPTMGFNADGQHNHIKDTVIPTFIHYNIPLLLAGWIAALVL